MARIVGNLSDWHIFSENRNLIANDAQRMCPPRSEIQRILPMCSGLTFFQRRGIKGIYRYWVGMFPF